MCVSLVHKMLLYATSFSNNHQNLMEILSLTSQTRPFSKRQQLWAVIHVCHLKDDLLSRQLFASLKTKAVPANDISNRQK